jgi:ABC-type Fe3+ transport system permease subunit
MGMTDGQVLRQVELPLAMGVIVTGIRVATVIAVGVTTIAAAVGAGGLGVYIFRGLRQYDNNLLLAGALSAAVLALAADLFLGLLERQFSFEAKRKTARFALPVVVLVVVAAAVFAFWNSGGSGKNSSDRKTSPNQRCSRKSSRRCSRRGVCRLKDVSSWAGICRTKLS